jgi:hypothetical protein
MYHSKLYFCCLSPTCKLNDNSSGPGAIFTTLHFLNGLARYKHSSVLGPLISYEENEGRHDTQHNVIQHNDTQHNGQHKAQHK